MSVENAKSLGSCSGGNTRKKQFGKRNKNQEEEDESLHVEKEVMNSVLAANLVNSTMSGDVAGKGRRDMRC